MIYSSENGTRLYLAPYGVGFVHQNGVDSQFGYAIRGKEIECSEGACLELEVYAVVFNGEKLTLTSAVQPDVATMIDEVESMVEGRLLLFARSNLSKICMIDAIERTKRAIGAMKKMIIDAEQSGIAVPDKAYRMLQDISSKRMH